jgi:hypothetical protein
LPLVEGKKKKLDGESEQRMAHRESSSTSNKLGDIVWMGSAYGWCAPRAHRSYASAQGAIDPIDPIGRDSNEGNANHDPKASNDEQAHVTQEIRRIDFPHCGPVRIQQQPWALDNTARRYDGTTGRALWSGSFFLAHYVDNMLKSEDWMIDNDNSGEMESNLRPVFLELGAGLGLPSAMAGKCGMDVIATDYDDAVLPLL